MIQLSNTGKYLLKKQVLALTGKFRIYDQYGTQILFSEQKMFALREDIRVYSDETKSREILLIKARNIIDFSAAYDVIDATTGTKVGVLRRKGWKSMIRDEWEVLDPLENFIATLSEDSIGLALLRRFLTGALVPQNYDVLGKDGIRVVDLKQRFTIVGYELDIDLTENRQNLIDPRIGIAMGILLAAIEGKQSN